MTAAIEVKGLCKSYGGTRVLEDVSFSVGKNTICGLLGRNGAGKTTIMSILSGQEPKTAGRVLVNGGEPFENAAVLSGLCFVRENQKYPEDFKASHVLRTSPWFFENWDAELAGELAEAFRLPLRPPIKKLSRGQLSVGGDHRRHGFPRPGHHLRRALPGPGRHGPRHLLRPAAPGLHGAPADHPDVHPPDRRGGEPAGTRGRHRQGNQGAGLRASRRPGPAPSRSPAPPRPLPPWRKGGACCTPSPSADSGPSPSRAAPTPASAPSRRSAAWNSGAVSLQELVSAYGLLESGEPRQGVPHAQSRPVPAEQGGIPMSTATVAAPARAGKRHPLAKIVRLHFVNRSQMIDVPLIIFGSVVVALRPDHADPPGVRSRLRGRAVRGLPLQPGRPLVLRRLLREPRRHGLRPHHAVRHGHGPPRAGNTGGGPPWR